MSVEWNPHPKDYLGDQERLYIQEGVIEPPDFSKMRPNPGPALFPKVIDYLDTYFCPATRAEQVISALYCFQAWALEVLSDVFFLFLAGPPGGGKSNQLESLTLLTEGALENDVSRAALGRYFPVIEDDAAEDGESDRPRKRSSRSRMMRSLAIDEASTKSSPNELAERDRLLRASYKRSIGATYTRYNPERGRNESFNTFGPKAMAVTGSLDPGLASRGFVVAANPANGPEYYRLVLAEKARMVDQLHRPIILDFKSWNRWVTTWWRDDRIATLQQSDNHRKAVELVVDELGANRPCELMTTAVTVAMLAGVDLSRELKEISESLGSAGLEEEEVRDQILDALIAVAGRQTTIESAKEIVIKQADVLREVNECRNRLEPPLRPLSSHAFAEGYRLLIPANMVRNRHGSNYWVIPVSYLTRLQALYRGEGGLVHLPHLPHLPEKPVQQSLKVGQVDQVGQEGGPP
ncbi:MAG: hypothetical protein QXU73_01445 [Thermoplasmata archaeon]